MDKKLALMIIVLMAVLVSAASASVVMTVATVRPLQAELVSAEAEISGLKQSLFWSEDLKQRARVEYIVGSLLRVFDGELTGAEEIEIVDLRTSPKFAESIYKDVEGTHVKWELSTGRTVWFSAKHDGGSSWSSSSPILRMGAGWYSAIGGASSGVTPH